MLLPGCRRSVTPPPSFFLYLPSVLRLRPDGSVPAGIRQIIIRQIHHKYSKLVFRPVPVLGAPVFNRRGVYTRGPAAARDQGAPGRSSVPQKFRKPADDAADGEGRSCRAEGQIHSVRFFEAEGPRPAETFALLSCKRSIRGCSQFAGSRYIQGTAWLPPGRQQCLQRRITAGAADTGLTCSRQVAVSI